MPVHFGGLAVDMERLASLIDLEKTIIIEDGSHALGAKYLDGTMVGSCKYSKCTVFSFHAVKIATTGEGGIVTTNDEQIYRNLLRLRSHGINKLDDHFENTAMAYDRESLNPWYYEMQQLGYNYRLTDIQAALGLSQLSRLNSNFAKRQEIAFNYDKYFAEDALIKPLQNAGRDRNSHHLYPILIDFSKISITRRELMASLKNSGIGTQVHYIPVHLQPFYAQRASTKEYGLLKGALEYYSQVLSIPCFPDLTVEQQLEIINNLRLFVNN